MANRGIGSRPTAIEWLGIFFFSYLLYVTVGSPTSVTKHLGQGRLEELLDETLTLVQNDWKAAQGTLTADEFTIRYAEFDNRHLREQLHFIEGGGLLIGIVGEDRVHSTADDKYYYLPLD